LQIKIINFGLKPKAG